LTKKQECDIIMIQGREVKLWKRKIEKNLQCST
jgi:hypothetical protein